MNIDRKCRTCGNSILALAYPAEHCWMCLRYLVERGKDRYYYLDQNNNWAEISELAGVNPLANENKEQIKIIQGKYKTEKGAKRFFIPLA